MTCHAYMLTGVGLDLMHLLGWVSMHDTHHHMGFLRKKIVVGIFGVWIFGLLHRRDGTLGHVSHQPRGTCEQVEKLSNAGTI